MNERQKLEQAITTQESFRGTVDDTIIDLTIAVLYEKLDQLEPPPQQQRKQMSILFADIVDSTGLIHDLDPEENLEIIDHALKRLSAPVEQHGGHVTRYMGDGFKAVFGKPVAHENDPEMAIKAGLSILEVARTYADELAARRDITDFQMRVGINTGWVATGGETEAEDTVVGPAVNLAERVQSAAPPGGLLISHNTYIQVRGLFYVDPLPKIEVKGFDEPVQVYLVESVRPRTFWTRTPVFVGVETRMVGRETELGDLQSALQDLFQRDQGGMITISGEAGVGKSRLLYEFESWVHLIPEYVFFFKGRGRQETQRQPYSLLRDLFTIRFQIQENDRLTEVHEKLETGFGEIFGLDEHGMRKAHIIAQLLGFDFSTSPQLHGLLKNPQQLSERGLLYLEEFFQTTSDIDPVLIFMEDIHWADDSSLHVVDRLSLMTPEKRLLVVCVTRNRLFERRPDWGRAWSAHTRLALEPLSTQQSRSLVEEILQKADHLPEALSDLVVSSAEGNPFYVEELVKMLIDDGVILVGEEHWRVLPDRLSEIKVPPTLTSVLQARLDALPAAERLLLQQAAVMGRTFWDASLAYINQNLDQGVGSSEIPAALSSLMGKEILYSEKVSAFRDAQEFNFKHIMLRDVTYESVLMRERKDYHGAVAEWFVETTRASSRSDEYAVIIADHFLGSREPQAAIEWLFLAGKRAKSQDAMPEARTHFSSALDMVPADDLEKRWSILLERDEVLAIIGDTDARLAEDQALIDLALALADDNYLAEAYYRQGYFLGTLGKYTEELGAYEQSQIAAIHAGNRRLEILVLGLMVFCHTRLGEMDSAAQKAETTLDLLDELDDEEDLALTLTNIAVYYETGDIGKAITLLGRAIDVTRRFGNHNLEASIQGNLGYLYTLIGAPEQGVPHLENSIKLADAIGNQRLVAYGRLNLGLAYLRLCDEPAAQGSISLSKTAFSEMDDEFAQAACHSYLGLLLESCGKSELAADQFTAAMREFDNINVRGSALDARAGLCRSLMAQGKVGQAGEHVIQVWAFLSLNGPEGLEFPVLTYLTCAQIFEEGGDIENMKHAVDAGVKHLQERADRISDQHWRKTYLQSVPEHQAIQQLWEENSNIPNGG
jgi:class 3 adenylate cyclase/tetratricopeptide (TPR) repeat protein